MLSRKKLLGVLGLVLTVAAGGAVFFKSIPTWQQLPDPPQHSMEGHHPSLQVARNGDLWLTLGDKDHRHISVWQLNNEQWYKRLDRPIRTRNISDYFQLKGIALGAQGTPYIAIPLPGQIKNMQLQR